MTNKPKILCTGAPRSGTSLFNLLMVYFKDLLVEINGTPSDLFKYTDVFTSQQRPDGKIWNDFIGGGNKLSFKDILTDKTYLIKGDKEIKLIVIYRDGRDCFVSARMTRPNISMEIGATYHSLKTETTYWYTMKEIEKWFNSIKEIHKTIEAIKDTPLENNFLVVKYEDLVNNPEIEMKRVEDFVGLPLDPDYTKFYEKANYRRMLSSPQIMGIGNTIALREDSSVEGALGSEYIKHRPIAPDSIGRWKKPIHKERMKEILSVYGEQLSDMLIELEYETDKKWINELN